jgi:hypothetical protein
VILYPAPHARQQAHTESREEETAHRCASIEGRELVRGSRSPGE